jgi:MotA/TolQ/ExbB proton channel family
VNAYGRFFSPDRTGSAASEVIGGSGLVAPTQVTSGVAQALIATALGLLIAIFALFGFNFFARMQSQALDRAEGDRYGLGRDREISKFRSRFRFNCGNSPWLLVQGLNRLSQRRPQQRVRQHYVRLLGMRVKPAKVGIIAATRKLL